MSTVDNIVSGLSAYKPEEANPLTSVLTVTNKWSLAAVEALRVQVDRHKMLAEWIYMHPLTRYEFMQDVASPDRPSDQICTRILGLLVVTSPQLPRDALYVIGQRYRDSADPRAVAKAVRLRADPLQELQEETERLGLYDDLNDEEYVRTTVEWLAGELEKLQPDQLARLHPIEQLMVRDVVADHRHLKCGTCLKWMRRLLNKAEGYNE